MISTGCSGSKYTCSIFTTTLTNSNSANAVRYGTAKAEWFLNLVDFALNVLSTIINLTHFLQTVVLPSGEVIKTRRRARKSSAGFDATKLFIGAEGTLGIVTEGKIFPRKSIK